MADQPAGQFTSTSTSSPEARARRPIPPAFIGGAVLAAALLLFVFQNTRRTKVQWLVFEQTAPLWTVLLVTAVVSLVAGELIGMALRRRRRRTAR